MSVADLPSSTALNLFSCPVYGLILAGGYSSRMGKSKWALEYHGKSQLCHCAALLSSVCGKVFVSCRSDQSIETSGLARIEDEGESKGPLTGIVSAMISIPASAWLVISCDMPLLGLGALQRLIQARNPLFEATAYANAETGMPEPLCAIYEPRMAPVLKQRLEENELSPREALLHAKVKLISSLDASELINVNSPEEYLAVRARLKGD